MPLAPGTKLGPYEIVSPLGAVGMGEVYRARDTRLDRDVAVKILGREMSPDPARKQRFQREAKTISALNHPNICVLHDIGSQDGADYLVMECVEGETLAARLRSGPLAPEKISNYALQILDGLEKAHRQGILHRDLKPSNVMLTIEGRVKLLDFGLAKQLERPTSTASPHGLQTVDFETAYGAPAGTFAYMSPEQALGKQLDARSDLFSFGTMLYEMATGTRPFAGDAPIELCDAILHRQPTQPKQLNPSIDAGLQGIVLKCLEKEADLRYQTASEIATDFRRLKRSSNSANSAVPDQQNSSGNRASAKAMQLTLRAAGAGIALLLIGGIAAWMRHSGRTPTSESTSEIHSLAVLPLKNLSSDATQEYFADGTTLDLITTLTKISNLKVISWTSVRGYKNTTKNLQEIGKELNADGVIDGSVEQSGDHVKITIGLIDARNDRNIWGQSYNRELRDILRLQEEVAGTVASEIRVALTPQDRARLSGRVRSIRKPICSTCRAARQCSAGLRKTSVRHAEVFSRQFRKTQIMLLPMPDSPRHT